MLFWACQTVIFGIFIDSTKEMKTNDVFFQQAASSKETRSLLKCVLKK